MRNIIWLAALSTPFFLAGRAYCDDTWERYQKEQAAEKNTGTIGVPSSPAPTPSVEVDKLMESQALSIDNSMDAEMRKVKEAKALLTENTRAAAQRRLQEEYGKQHGQPSPYERQRVIHNVSFTRAGVPALGHGNPHQPPYQIYNTNCHNASNAFIYSAEDKSKVGILSCEGDPQRSPSYHTANWIVKDDGQTCIYNWGNARCWPATAIPPDICTGKGLEAAQWACGTGVKGHYCDETSCLPAGQMVEEPGPNSCMMLWAYGRPDAPPNAVGNFDPAKVGDCLRCCDFRADYWSHYNASDKERETFRRDCQAVCKQSFAPGPHRDVALPVKP